MRFDLASLVNIKCPENGKTRYSSRKRAKRAGKRLGKQYHCRFKVYRCKHCTSFHLATRRKEK